ncbi:hypothetical protein QIT38_gp19 [Methanocaldococcus fervens tailed virus 1]|uniref:Phage tail tape measure protein domain-containing protein n=1 Tax=Methanocaldococcus fervens tailed virus 1 TaxID=2759191 RepID=A0A7G9VYS4_9CAUD|nr:hypothetical protein [Methanocaldococcus fervens]YP_010772314.1 hypothetical protein QIT38_gp19 [Methanocaldococcus fervens tailed virus 1]QNO11489.1 hypothetical protein [Methanocaldococcus fervens tailed virus 1]
MKKLKVEGTLELKLDDKDVRKNLKSLEKIKSKLEIEGNINAIIKQLDELKNVKSEVEFKSNINMIIRELEEIEAEASKMNINFDYDLSKLKSELEQLKNTKIDIKTNTDYILKQINKIKSELSEKQTIRAKVEVDRTEWDKLKKEWSEKYHIDAIADVASVGTAYMGISDAEKYNELITILRERGLTKDQAERLIQLGLYNGYSLDEIKDGLGYANEAVLKLAASNDKYAAQILAAMAMAERGGSESGADDIRRMITALAALGKSNEEIMKMVNAEVLEMKQGHTEVAEAIREFSITMGDTLDPETFASILIQAQAAGAQDVGQLADAINALALNARQMGFDVKTALKEIQKTKDDKTLAELAKKYGLTYEQIVKIHDYLQRVDLDKGLPDNTNELDRLISINKDQRGILETIKQDIEGWLAGHGFLQYGAELGVTLGGLGKILEIAIGAAIGSALKDAFGKIKSIFGKISLDNLKLPELSKIKLPVDLEIPKIPKLHMPKIKLPVDLKLPKIPEINIPKINLPNISGLSNAFRGLGEAVRFAGRAFGVLSVVIEPLKQLLKGDIQGAIEHLKIGLIELAAWPVALGEMLAAVTLAVGDFLGLFDLDGDSPLAAARAGILTLLAAFESIYSFITGDWSVVTNTLQEAFETLGMKEDEARQAAENLAQQWQQLPQQILDAFNGFVDNIKQTFNRWWYELNIWWSQKIEEAKNWGSDLIQNIIDGIKRKFSELRNAVSQAASIISNYLHHTTPETGPLKDDDKWGIHFMENIIGGIRKEIPNLKKTIDYTAQLMSSANPKNWKIQQVGMTHSTSYSYGDIHINVVGNSFNEHQLAQKIALILKRQQFR